VESLQGFMPILESDFRMDLAKRAKGIPWRQVSLTLLRLAFSTVALRPKRSAAVAKPSRSNFKTPAILGFFEKAS
jgi:hypothetical protein